MLFVIMWSGSHYSSFVSHMSASIASRELSHTVVIGKTLVGYPDVLTASRLPSPNLPALDFSCCILWGDAERCVYVCVCVFKKVWILIPHVIADRNCIFSYSLIVILVQWLLFLRSKWATWNFPADLTPWHSLPFQLSHPLPPCDKYSFSKPD